RVEKVRAGRSDRHHIERRVWLASGGQRVLAMAGAARVCQVQMFEDCRDAALVRVELHRGPREIVVAAGVFRLDADEMRVAALLSVPLALARVIASARGNDVERAVASQSEVRERSRKIRTAVDDRPQ